MHSGSSAAAVGRTDIWITGLTGSQCLLLLRLPQKRCLLPWPLISHIFFKGRKQKASFSARHMVSFAYYLIVIFLASLWKNVSLEVLWSWNCTWSVVVMGFPLSLSQQKQVQAFERCSCNWTNRSLQLNMVIVLLSEVSDWFLV